MTHQTPSTSPTRPPQRRTRKPTGLPSWPITLIAGVPKAGKTYTTAEATGSDLIGGTYWIGVGEDDPDEYSLIPGARFEIVEHDGTFRDILAAITWATQQPTVGDRPNLVVVDSISHIWSLLSSMAQQEATARQLRKEAKYGRKPSQPPADEAPVSMDLWNIAADRWWAVIDVLRAHQGPVIATAMLELVTLMKDGKPTTDKEWKIQGHKSLPGAVGVIVKMPQRGQALLSGVRSLRLKFPDEHPVPGLTIDRLWREMGLADGQVGERHHSSAHVEQAQPELEQSPAREVRPVSPAPVPAQGRPPVEGGDLGRVADALRAEIAKTRVAADVSVEQVHQVWARSSAEDFETTTDVAGLTVIRDSLNARAKTLLEQVPA